MIKLKDLIKEIGFPDKPDTGRPVKKIMMFPNNIKDLPSDIPNDVAVVIMKIYEVIKMKQSHVPVAVLGGKSKSGERVWVLGNAEDHRIGLMYKMSNKGWYSIDNTPLDSETLNKIIENWTK